MSNREDQCRPRWSRGWHCFRGVTFPMLPSLAVNIYHIVLNVNEIHCLHYVWFQSNQGRVNVWVCVSHFVNQLFIRRQAESMVNRSRLILRSRYFLEYHPSSSNITRYQGPSRLGRGLMIQRVVLILFKCLLANQNRLFYMKVWN